ncbi:hypothetical protein V8E52_006063 [Russula decolorans]
MHFGNFIGTLQKPRKVLCSVCAIGSHLAHKLRNKPIDLVPPSLHTFLLADVKLLSKHRVYRRSIPLAGLDVPFHARYLWSGVMPFWGYVDLRSASTTRALKRSHSVIATGSAPARLTIPLPNVEYVQPEDDQGRKLLAIAPAPSPAFASASMSTSTSTSTPSPVPTFPAPSAPVSTPAYGRP